MPLLDYHYTEWSLGLTIATKNMPGSDHGNSRRVPSQWIPALPGNPTNTVVEMIDLTTNSTEVAHSDGDTTTHTPHFPLRFYVCTGVSNLIW